jgi:hypothetical protein
VLTVVETAEFQKQAKAVWNDAEREAFIDWIRAGMGKRGGVRVIYFHLTDEEIVLLVMVYAKAVRTNVKPKDIKRG